MFAIRFRRVSIVISDPVSISLFIASILLCIYVSTLNFYRYLLVKAHCPDLNVRNSVGEMEFFVVEFLLRRFIP